MKSYIKFLQIVTYVSIVIAAILVFFTEDSYLIFLGTFVAALSGSTYFYWHYLSTNGNVFILLKYAIKNF
jgi:hypothetical protein